MVAIDPATAAASLRLGRKRDEQDREHGREEHQERERGGSHGRERRPSAPSIQPVYQALRKAMGAQVSRVSTNIRNAKSAINETISIQLNLPSSSMARERIE